MKMQALVSAVLILFAGAAFAQAVSQTAPRAPTREAVTTNRGEVQAGKEAAKKDLGKHSTVIRTEKANRDAQSSTDRVKEKEEQQANTQKNMRQAVDRYNEARQASQNNLGR